MIAMLRGTIYLKDFTGVVLDVNGVGYRVNMPMTSLDDLPSVGGEVTLHIHTAVREDAFDLFGFSHDTARRLFVKLIGVNGVGPRLALNILSYLTPSEVVSALVRGDLAVLKSVKGVGAKTAERLVLELRDKVKDLPIEQASTSSLNPSGELPMGAMLDDLRSALLNLGYPSARAEKTLSAVQMKADGEDFNGLLKLALKELRG